MYISRNWLQDFVDIAKVKNQDLANRLTLATTEIEGIKDFNEVLDKIIVGKVQKKEKHPDADKLSVCEVFDGKNTHTVVCGADNVSQDMLIAYAPSGAKVKWHGEGDLVTLKKAKIRGVESNGMICAAVEIGLTDKYKEEDGILDITSTNAKPGTPLAKALGLDEIVFELDNKSVTHRPDLWGIYGIAREVAALYEKDLKPYPQNQLKIQESDDISVNIKISDKKGCPRYSAIALDNIKVQESPLWMQARLIASGMRPINNVVDITNYVLLEIGQPLHAFDVDQIGTKQGAKTLIDIDVRKAKNKEIFTALDGSTHELVKEQLVISNDKEVLAVAGIKGGFHSGISENTTRILLESAHFDATTVRKGSSIIGIRSEASSRYEKSLDPNLTEIAMKRACQLFQELIPGAKVVTQPVDVNYHESKPVILKTTTEYIQNRIGMEISEKEIVNILKSLEFGVKKEKDTLVVEVPSFRSTKDVLHEYDLVEEVVRIYGYDRIEPELPKLPMRKARINENREFEKQVKQILIGEGLTETYNYAFTSEVQQDPFKSDIAEFIEVADPFSSQVTHLRRDLMAGLLENVKDNEHEFDSIRMFEIGRVFLKEEKSVYPMDDTQKDMLPKQPVMLGLVLSEKEKKDGYGLLKGMVETILDSLQLSYVFQESEMGASWSQMGATADILVNGNKIGEISKVRKHILKQTGIKRPVYQCQINIDELFDIYQNKTQSYIAVHKYPAVELDMAIVVDKKVVWQDIKEVIEQKAGKLLDSLEVFDVYEGNQIDEDKKSIAFHIRYRSSEKTLTMDEANGAHNKVLSALEEKFQAKLRA